MKLVDTQFIVRLNRVDLITLSSVLTTFISMVYAIDGYVYFSMALLFIAMTADALDGILARKWGLERDFGRYLDGFMDVLIYLVVPSIIMVQWGFDGYWSVFILLMIACGCIRLSVFNQIGNVEQKEEVQVSIVSSKVTSKKLSYKGMPVFWSVFILAGALILEKLLGTTIAYLLLALSLTVFSFYMVVDKAFFKFRSIKQILSLTLGGFIIFSILTFQTLGFSSPLYWFYFALYLQIPVVIGGILHMVIVKRNDFPSLVTPIHKRWFGENKTWRGVVVVPLLTAFGAVCLWPIESLISQFYGSGILDQWSLIYVGLCAGIGYILGELPNSFFKRRIGIKAGEVPEDKKYWFIALDQLDSAIGVALAYWWVLDISFEVVAVYIITFPITALLVKRWLYQKQLKHSAT